MHTLAHRVRARLGAVPVPRLRQLLLAIYLLTAAIDATGKALAATPAFNNAMSRLLKGEAGAQLRSAGHPSGNFEIFRASSRHLFAGRDLYAEYPAEHSDRFKYSPTFALLFSPLAWLPWPLALFLWSALNALVLFAAVERVLPQRSALLAMACMHLEVLRSMQNAQSNALVAGLIVLAYAALERRGAWRAAAAVVLGACIKIFPLAALTFAIPQRMVWRTGLRAAALGTALIVLPLLVTSPATLLAQYHWWRGVESSDALQRWFSAMALIQQWTGANAPNWWIQLAGIVVLIAPLWLHRERWGEPRFRLLYLCSTLLFTVLLNHQAERASYLIAFTGSTLWYASSPKTRWRNVLYGVTFVTIPLMSTLIPGEIFKTRTVMLYRLALPSLLIWLSVLWELFRPAAAAERAADEPATAH